MKQTVKYIGVAAVSSLATLGGTAIVLTMMYRKTMEDFKKPVSRPKNYRNYSAPTTK